MSPDIRLQYWSHVSSNYEVYNVMYSLRDLSSSGHRGVDTARLTRKDPFVIRNHAFPYHALKLRQGT
jgi:hypothetical protein